MTASSGTNGPTFEILANRIDDTSWELRLSTGGNTARGISTYRTDGKAIVPTSYERHAVLSRARRYVYKN